VVNSAMNSVSNIEAIEKSSPCEDVIHGGDLQAATKQYGINKDQWIDLSTGLNPNSYPVNNIPSEVFSELPYLSNDLMHSAAKYYSHDSFIAVNGTQLAIQTLPSILPKFDILIPKLGYQEHALHWKKAGVKIQHYQATDQSFAVGEIDDLLAKNNARHLLIINPNNPSGLTFQPDQILSWAKQLQKGCYLVVDEAFMDLKPTGSVLNAKMPDNIIVLRSFGKFFGLAGIRMGFVFAAKNILDQLKQKLGLWAVNGPAQYLAIQALKDERWQAQARIDIESSSIKSQRLFNPLFQSKTLTVYKQTHQGLFSSYWLNSEQAKIVYQYFAYRGILLRVIPFDGKTALLRIGLADVNKQNVMNRIKEAINDFLAEINTN